VVSPFVLTALPFLLLRNSFIKKVLRDVDLFISPSKFLLRELHRQGVNCSPSVIIPYGSDGMHTVMKPTNRKEIRFGYLGNISKKKGIDVLVKAFQGRLAELLIIRGFSDSSAMEDFRKP
jgi:glycosyltransferase involved in cell wall biosynthesis